MEAKEFEKQYMQRLNARQKEAVFAVDGPVLLLATPGSGKNRAGDPECAILHSKDVIQ